MFLRSKIAWSLNSTYQTDLLQVVYMTQGVFKYMCTYKIYTNL